MLYSILILPPLRSLNRRKLGAVREGSIGNRPYLQRRNKKVKSSLPIGDTIGTVVHLHGLGRIHYARGVEGENTKGMSCYMVFW